MNKNTKNEIEAFLEKWDQDNTPETYVPIRDGEYLYVFGGCGGVVVYPSEDRLPFSLLGSDDGHYFITDNPIWDNFWLDDLIKILEVVKEYISSHATEKYFTRTNILCGYKLPWKNKSEIKVVEVKKYKKKPIIVEAVQYIRGREATAVEFLGGKSIGNCVTDTAIYEMNWYDQSVSIKIKTLEGLMEVSDGDYIIKGIHGEFYPCKPDIFEKTYELVED